MAYTGITLLQPNEVLKASVGSLLQSLPTTKLDRSLVQPKLLIADANYSKAFFKDDMYNDLLEKRNENEIDYTATIPVVMFPDDPELEYLAVRWLFPMAVLSVLVEAAYTIQNKLTPAGAVKQKDKNYDNAEIGQIVFDLQRNITLYNQQMYDYIYKNRSLYPLFNFHTTPRPKDRNSAACL